MVSRLRLFFLGLALLWPSRHAAAFSEQDQYINSDIYASFFLKESVGPGQQLYRTARMRSVPQGFVEPKPAATTRIFVTGGSIANVFLSVRENPDDRLDRLLGRSFPARKFEVIDCGMPAYESYRESLLLREILSHAPDAVILMTGNNEAHGNGARASPFFRILRPFTGFKCFRRLLREATRRWALPGLAPYGMPVQPAGAIREDWLRAFYGNLVRMVRTAKAAGVPMVLCTLPVNFRDMPPQGELPVWDRVFLEAFESAVRGEYLSAARGFRAYVDAHPEDAFGRYYLAKAWDAAGLAAQARGAYLEALDRDRFVRCSSGLNAVIRRVAGQENLPLADIEKEFLAVAPGGLLGSGFFVDGVHWHVEYNRLADKAIMAALRDLGRGGWSGLGGPPGPAPVPEREGGKDRPVRIGADARRDIHRRWMLYGISAILDMHSRRMPWRLEGPERFSEYGEAFFDMLLRRDPGMLMGLADREDWVRSRLKDNSWSADRLAVMADAWPKILAHAGEACRRRRLYKKAVEFFSAALARDPDRPLVRLHRGLARLALGDKAGAKEDISRAAAESREFPELEYYMKSAGAD